MHKFLLVLVCNTFKTEWTILQQFVKISVVYTLSLNKVGILIAHE